MEDADNVERSALNVMSRHPFAHEGVDQVVFFGRPSEAAELIVAGQDEPANVRVLKRREHKAADSNPFAVERLQPLRQPFRSIRRDRIEVQHLQQIDVIKADSNRLLRSFDFERARLIGRR